MNLYSQIYLEPYLPLYQKILSNMSSNNLQNTCSEIINIMMDYMDISDLIVSSTLCKDLNKDANNYSHKTNKCDLNTLKHKHTCRNCRLCCYEVEKEFCNDCFLHKCDNCFAVRNSMTEFVKYSKINNDGYNEIKLMCFDYCMFRCFKCKYVDTRHNLFLNDEEELQTICVDCFVDLNDEQKNKYKHVFNNEEWDDLDALD